MNQYSFDNECMKDDNLCKKIDKLKKKMIAVNLFRL